MCRPSGFGPSTSCVCLWRSNSAVRPGERRRAALGECARAPAVAPRRATQQGLRRRAAEPPGASPGRSSRSGPATKAPAAGEQLKLAEIELPQGHVVHQIARALEPVRARCREQRRQLRLDLPQVGLDPRQLLPDGPEGDTALGDRVGRKRNGLRALPGRRDHALRLHPTIGHGEGSSEDSNFRAARKRARLRPALPPVRRRARDFAAQNGAGHGSIG